MECVSNSSDSNLTAWQVDMSQFKADFSAIEWESPTPGARFKSHAANGKQLRLLELSSEFIELNWCEKGHIGFVLEWLFRSGLSGSSGKLQNWRRIVYSARLHSQSTLNNTICTIDTRRRNLNRRSGRNTAAHRN
jgi:hypothetical protein